jgi:uncharacterized protein with PIN domain
MGKRATLRFYAELNDFLPPARRFADCEHSFLGSPSVKDVIESIGVPHTEVEMILVNGESRGFDYRLQDGDRVSVYPMFEALDVGAETRVRPEPLREPRFILDVHLGRLARILRLLGFDALYANDAEDGWLASIAAAERRILLTRDRQLPKRRIVTHAYCLRSQQPRQQAVEVLCRFDLTKLAAPFTRCLRCNGRLEPVGIESVGDRIPPGVRGRTTEVVRCGSCRQVYWKGTHYERLERLARELLERAIAVGQPQAPEPRPPGEHG